MEQKDTIIRLAQSLKAAGVDKETGVNISLRLRAPGRAEQLIEWLSEHKSATPEEICKKSREMARKRG